MPFSVVVDAGWLAIPVVLVVLAFGLCAFRSRRIRRLLEEQTRANAEIIREQASIYKDLIERAGDGVILVQNGIIVQANRQVLEISGSTREAVVGQVFSKFVPADELEKVGEYYSRRMRGEEAPNVYETKLLSSKGSTLEVEISAGLVPMQGGVADLVLIRDISERKRNESILRQNARELELANKQLQLAMERSNELAAKAEAANRAKTDFLANMSHELRTPLTTIMGMTELLKDGAYGPIDERLAEGLGTIDASSQHLLDLINDILDIAKLETGNVDLERKPIEIRALCSTSVSFLQETANRKNVTMTMDCAGAPHKFWADGRRLRQILINLLGNAVKFTPEGGSVGLIASNMSAGQGVKFTVWDTGIGIAQDKIDQIFQPFEKLENSSTQRLGGSGLGLSLVKRLVQLHGGSIEVRSALGQGSHFTVLIPDPVAGMNLASTVEQPSRQQSLKGLRILLAEDEPTNASIIQIQLERRGASVRVAENGQIACDLVRAERPDVVLMDVQMPVLNGFQATSRMKSDPVLCKIPVICLTALASLEDKQNCLTVGADDFLAKPVDINALVARIQTLVVSVKPS